MPHERQLPLAVSRLALRLQRGRAPAAGLCSRGGCGGGEGDAGWACALAQSSPGSWAGRLFLSPTRGCRLNLPLARPLARPRPAPCLACCLYVSPASHLCQVSASCCPSALTACSLSKPGQPQPAIEEGTLSVPLVEGRGPAAPQVPAGRRGPSASLAFAGTCAVVGLRLWVPLRGRPGTRQLKSGHSAGRGGLV